jgi:transcriptional regulator with XRE-family HTH domain
MITKQSKAALDYLESLTGSKLTLGNLLLSIRQGEAMSQVDFSKQLGISRQNLCDIEHQRRFVSPKMAAEYAVKLGYSKNQFVRLCLQDLLDRDQLGMTVDVQEAA